MKNLLHVCCKSNVMMLCQFINFATNLGEIIAATTQFPMNPRRTNRDSKFSQISRRLSELITLQQPRFLPSTI
jgi:hypothetical protein